MREILFRGKRSDTGEWVYGNVDFNLSKSLVYIRTPLEKWANVNMVFPNTVGEYTGLEDKNGKRIFEGDILTGAWNTKIVIYFDECYLQFRAREVAPHTRENAIDYYNNGKLEIIGNIHDNPELLES